MPSTAEYLAAQPDVLGAMKAGNSYADSLFAKTAQVQAGQQYANKDYAGAGATLANVGDIGDAAKIHSDAIAEFQQQHAYIARAVPVFQQIYQQASQGGQNPQAGAQAVANAFDHIAPELKQIGGTDESAAQMRQALLSDPVNTLASLGALADKKLQAVKVSDTETDLVDMTTGQVMGRMQGSKYITTGPGQGISEVGPGVGSADDSSPQLPGAAAAQPAPQGGTSLFNGPVNHAAVAAVESNNDPNAVSPVGASGTMQTMPGTLIDPGYGVAPAQPGADGTVPPAEKTRVGDQYLDAMGQHFGNPIDQLAAYNWGPDKVQKWIAQGRHVQQLPPAVKDYILKVAIAQVNGTPAPAPQQTSNPNVRVISQAGPVWRDATPDEAKTHPGVRQVNAATGEMKFEPMGLMEGDPAQSDTAAKMVANYQMPPPSPRTTATAQGAAFMAKVAKFNPDYHAENYGKYADGYKKFSTGRQADTIRSLNTWVQHAQVLTDAANALGNGNMQAFNAASNWWRQQMGSPLPTDFQGVANIYNDEGVKAILGTGGALGDRQKFDDAMSKASSPSQIAGITRRYTQLASGQLNSYRIQYKNATGRSDFDSLLAPETIQALERHAGTKPGNYTPAQKAALKKYGL